MSNAFIHERSILQVWPGLTEAEVRVSVMHEWGTLGFERGIFNDLTSKISYDSSNHMRPVVAEDSLQQMRQADKDLKELQVK